MVLELEELERKGLSGVEEGERAELVSQRKELASRAFMLLRLKGAREASSK